MAAGTLAALALAEGALRVVGYEGAHERLVVDFDSEYGVTPEDAWIATETLEPGRRFRMAEREHAVDREEGVRRFLFVGDSGTAGSGVEPSEAFPFAFERVDRSLRPDAPMEVINAGVAGLSTVGELNLFRDRLLVLRPDVVVIGLFMANDLQFNLAQVRGYGRQVPGWLREHSALAHALYLRWMVSTRGTALSPTPFEEHGVAMNEYVEGEMASYIVPVGPTFRLAYDVLEHTLAQFQALAEEHCFELAVVLVPTLATIAGRLLWKWPSWEELELELRPGERFDVDRPTQEVLRVCEHLGLVCVDPTPRLRRELGTAAILENDDHPSAAAHQILAVELHARMWRERARFLEGTEAACSPSRAAAPEE